jgi:feruloyl esterase
MSSLRVACGPLLALIASFAVATPAAAIGSADCARLVALGVSSTTITSASLVAAGGGFPEYCNVVGHVDTEIDFNLRLPTQWNGKFYFGGLGGLDGLMPGPGAGLRMGYAEIGTNTGHVSTNGTLYDGSWAYHHLERQINWAYRSTHVVAEAGKAITAAYYGSAPRFSYYVGCSGGGRHAAMSAQRYPHDFDGVVSGDPFLSPAGQVIAWNWDEQALSATPIPPAKLAVIAKAALDECDAKDGVVDRLISDPRRCRFDPGTIACPAGTDRPDCLTRDQVSALRKFYGGPRDSRGEQLFPGWEPGLEDLGWPRALVHSVNGGPGELMVLIPDNFLKYFVYGPGFDPLSFDFDRALATLKPQFELFNVKPDLSAFARAGGKIVMYHGWADPRLVPTLSIQFHDHVRQNLDAKSGGSGDDRSRVQIDDFYRLFMVPGMLHCAGGTGPTSFDAFGALVKWVEQGTAPEVIVGSHLTSGVVDLTRPLCPYPQEAVYSGRGSITAAASFTCKVRNVRDVVNADFYGDDRERVGGDED